MAKVRAKVKVEPTIKNVEPTKVRSVDNKTTKKVEIEPKKVDDKKSTSDNRFERHKAYGDSVKRAEISEKVKQGLLKWAFYGVENDNGYQYYLKIKK